MSLIRSLRRPWLLAFLIIGAPPVHADPAFTLNDPGLEDIVSYDKYGSFSGIGTSNYRYYIKDREGLARAVGEGIYPNVTTMLHDPAYQKYQSQKQLDGSDWEFVN